MKLSSSLSFLTALVCATLASAQESITLSANDIERLGIAFAPVRSADSGSGARFPATVISSPEGVSHLTAPYAGVIETWLLTPGATVKPGQPLALLRSDDVLRVQQEWMQAFTLRETTRFELEKNERLFAEGVVSAQRVNQSKRDHEQATFAEQGAARLLHRVGFDAARLQAMRADGEGLGHYHLVSTSEGVMTRRHATTGDFIDANTSLVTLRANGAAWVSLQVPARAATGLTTGQILKTSRDDQLLTLRHIDQSVEGGSQTIGIFAEFNGETPYLPGQVITVELPAPRGAILVPSTAVVHSGEQTAVFVRTKDGIETRSLPLAPFGADYLAPSGLAEGDEVVVRGAAILKGIKAGLGRSE